MIHRYLCNPANTKHYSSLRMQFHFLLSRNVCWNGFIPLTRKEMAEELSCDIQSIDKFIKKGSKEGVLKLEGDRLFLVKHVTDYTKGYIKHFPFLESDALKRLNVHTQRFILYTLWYGVHTGRPLKRSLSALYHSTKDYLGVLNLYSKAPLYEIFEEAKAFLKLELIVERGKEMVRVTGVQDEYALQPALTNQGEMKYLENVLMDRYCDEHVSISSREEILKIKSHYFKELGSIGIDLFSHALEKLLTVHKLYELNNDNEVGKYLKSILKDLETNILPKLQKHRDQFKYAIKTMSDWIIPGVTDWIARFKGKIDLLTKAENYIRKKMDEQPPKKEEIEDFPFYNWLEA